MPLIPTESNDTVRNEQDVRDYYDDNTNLFQKLGAGGTTGAIHQPLFIEGNEKTEEAAQVQHKMILELIKRKDGNHPSHILDLGCGTGAAISYLISRLPKGTSVSGITISPKQADLGNASLRSLGAEHARIVCGSYLSIPDEIPAAGFAYAIESFIHATDAPAFFREASRKLTHRGRLVIFDDFLPKGGHAKPGVIDAFVDGWRANALHTIAELSNMAFNEGLLLTDAQNLTPYLRLWRVRDRFINAIQRILPVIPLSSQYKRFLRGGNARQQLYRRNNLVYAMLVFEKRD